MRKGWRLYVRGCEDGPHRDMCVRVREKGRQGVCMTGCEEGLRKTVYEGL